jgi:nucleotide-binding universal stress UspA family protein
MNERMKVMIAYDGSSYADAAIDDVFRAGLQPNPEILIVSVMDLSAVSPPISEFDLHSLISRRALMVIDQARTHTRKEIEKVKEYAAKAADRLRSRFPEAKVRYRVLYGKPAAEILRKAEEWKPDLIVAGSHGRSAIGRFFLGSVSQKIAEKADCSVRVVRRDPNNKSAATEIIAGADGLFAAEKLTRALGGRVWSGQTKLSLIIVAGGCSARSVSALDSKSTALFLQLAREFRLAGMQVSVEIKSGDLQDVLLAEAENRNADAIFVAAGTANDESVLNAAAASLITDANCTVEIVR